MKPQEIFKLACFTDDLQKLYTEHIEAGNLSSQLFKTTREGLVHKTWTPSKICRHTKQELTEENLSYMASYWIPYTWFPVHKDHRTAAIKQEAYDCQCLDYSCNDCINFDRIKGNHGTCKDTNKPKIACPNMCCPENADCFVHRLGQEN